MDIKNPGIPFAKYHGLGNDYLVVEPEHIGPTDLSGFAVRVCDRNRGVGADGVLVGPFPSERAAFRLRIYNPDGSEAEKSGNGLRIFSRYLWDTARVAQEEFMIDTLGGVVAAQVASDGSVVSVLMGQASFLSSEVGLSGPEREVIDEELVLPGCVFRYCAVSVGNPHCIVVDSEGTADVAQKWGPLIERLPQFRHRTNVQFMRVLDRNNIRIEIWERGAGYTLASGSSSTAAACAAKRLGLCDSVITVHMPGGTLKIEVEDNYLARMTGPVSFVASGKIALDVIHG